ncbi:hypothetical protein NPIL_439451, partial [Nephila pilipes]
MREKLNGSFFLIRVPPSGIARMEYQLDNVITDINLSCRETLGQLHTEQVTPFTPKKLKLGNRDKSVGVPI